MILRIEVQQNPADWTATLTSPDTPGWGSMVRSGDVDSEGYPAPPASESASWPAPAEPLCRLAGVDERRQAYNRFLRGDPRAGEQDVEALGGYLFAVLLGDAWTAVAGAGATDPIRIQLALPPHPVWWQLPWDLMTDGNSQPLAAFRRVVAITRLVNSDHAPQCLLIEIPIRVLFVVGREMDDQLRPGAEYMALLRQLSCTINTANEARGVALHARLLLEATTEDIEAAVREFRPTVVHIVSHGLISNDRAVLQLTKYEGAGRRNPKTDPVDSKRLAALLQASQPEVRPHAVLI